MRPFTLLLATSAISTVTASMAGANYGVDGLQARSSKDILRLLARSLDEDEAEALIARYTELDLGKRAESGYARNFRRAACSFCRGAGRVRGKTCTFCNGSGVRR